MIVAKNQPDIQENLEVWNEKTITKNDIEYTKLNTGSQFNYRWVLDNKNGDQELERNRRI